MHIQRRVFKSSLWLALVFAGTYATCAHAATPEISSVLQASAPINTAFSYTITATNAPTSFGASNFPPGAGWTVNTGTGVISGTPNTVGTFSIAISATNGSGTANATLMLNVYDPNVGGAPVISSDTAFSMVVNTAAANVYQVAASNVPTSFGASNLPAGLSIDSSTGIISASATTAAVGQYTITVTATNASGTGSLPVIVVINPSAGAPVIANASFEQENQNQSPNPLQPITLSSGTAVSFNAIGLPAGITLNTSTGVFSGLNPGTIWALATYFVIDAQGRTGVKTILIQIFPVQPPPNVTSGQPPVGTVGQPYSYQMTVDAAGTTFNAVGLVSGLTMNSATGLVSGTPTSSGQFTVTLSSTLAFGRSGQSGGSPATFVINPAPPSITSTTAVSGQVGTPLTYQILATGNPSSFGATNLPAGLSVNASGLITGTPTVSGAFPVTVSASKAGLTGTATVNFTIAPANTPIITSALTATASKGVAFSYQFTATGFGPITFSVANLPPGLTFTGATISGSPTLAGQVFILLSATNSGGTTTLPLQLNIAGGPGDSAPTFNSLPSATPNPAIAGTAVTLSASAVDPDGDLVGYSWDFGDGLFGIGSSVSHVYTAAGLYSAKVTISDGTLTDARTVVVGVNDPAAPIETFTVGKASIKFNFKKTGQDSLTLSGTVKLPAGFVLSTKKVSVAIGALQKDFVLSNRGKSGDTSASFTLSPGKTIAKYSLNLRRQTLLPALQSLGFTNATIARPGTKLTFPVAVSIDGVTNVANLTVTYTAKADKSGAAK
jgi:hypothetical protein